MKNRIESKKKMNHLNINEFSTSCLEFLVSKPILVDQQMINAPDGRRTGEYSFQSPIKKYVAMFLRKCALHSE